jgi:hypothetical protein
LTMAFKKYLPFNVSGFLLINDIMRASKLAVKF